MSKLSIVIGIQRTGQGHTGRMLEVIRHARAMGDVYLVASGTDAELLLPQTPAMNLSGLSLAFGRRGALDYWGTMLRIQPWSCGKLLANILCRPLPGGDRKIVISDFEPYTAWRARLEGVPVAQLSHQAAFLSPLCPRPLRRSRIAEAVMRWFARGNINVGLHYRGYDEFVRTPIIRREIRDRNIEDRGHYTVYLPAYAPDYTIAFLKQIHQVQWKLFDRRVQSEFEDGNVSVGPIDNQRYAASLATGAGLLTGGGVQSTSEALFLGKKLLAVPMRGQYEQACNAAALAELNVPLLDRLDRNTLSRVKDWVVSGCPLPRFDWPDHSAETVGDIVRRLSSRLESDRPASGCLAPQATTHVD